MISLRLAVFAILAAFVSPMRTAPDGPAVESQVLRIVVHIPLALNGGTPISPLQRRQFVASLAALGPVVEHVGRGTYIDSHTKHVAIDPVDHVVVTSASPRAASVVRALLVKMRRELQQDATLAEVVPDPGTWRPEEHRLQFEVRTRPQHGACDVACSRLRRLLDDAGGGASEYDDPRDGGHVISSVPISRAHSVRIALRRMHATFAERPAAFVLITS